MPYKDRAKHNEFNRLWIARRRAEYFAGKCCARCGSTDRLELDHINPETKISHAIWSWSATRRAAELAKCQPLCYHCHKAKSRAEKLQHGIARYDSGCRCEICRAAKAAKVARLRLARLTTL